MIGAWLFMSLVWSSDHLQRDPVSLKDLSFVVGASFLFLFYATLAVRKIRLRYSRTSTISTLAMSPARHVPTDTSSVS